MKRKPKILTLSQRKVLVLEMYVEIFYIYRVYPMKSNEENFPDNHV